jgi:hypothetical protein
MASSRIEGVDASVGASGFIESPDDEQRSRRRTVEDYFSADRSSEPPRELTRLDGSRPFGVRGLEA